MTDYNYIASIQQSTHRIDSDIRQEKQSENLQGQALALQAPATKKTKDSQGVVPGNGLDPLIIAYYLLTEAANLSANSAILHSKQLQDNARAEQNLDKIDAKFQWYQLPHLIVHSHWHCAKKKVWTGSFWNHSGHFYYYKKQWFETKSFPNQGAVNQAEAKNQQVVAARETIGDKLAVLQQIAQVGETNVSTTAQESMRAIDMASNLLQVLSSLTFHALMRQPPQ